MYYPDFNVELPDTIYSAHFIGLGGSGVSGVARLFHEMGIIVTGSDQSENSNTKSLSELGIKIYIGHDAQNIANPDVLVVTGATWDNNPELIAAQEKNIPVLHRSQALNYLFRNKKLISVAGAHGKTTSTGMIITAMLSSGYKPSFVNGGVIEGILSNAAWGDSEYSVIEADESDGSFLIYDTDIALITNIDPEHLDFYGSRHNFMNAFAKFCFKASTAVVMSADDPGCKEVLDLLDNKIKIYTFGFDKKADFKIISLKNNLDSGVVEVDYLNRIYSLEVKIPGEHNLINAVGAFASMVLAGLEPEKIANSVSSFTGTKRRFEHKFTIDNVHVYDDYAHHPTEVEALLKSARNYVESGRVIAIHQPHLYSRTKIFYKEFAEVLEKYADYTIVLEICGAREKPVPGVTGELVSNSFSDNSKVKYIDSWAEAANYVAKIARNNDYFFTMGCGDVYKIIPQLEQAIKNR